MTGAELYRLLLDGEPRIMSHAAGEGHSFVLRPVAIKPDDYKLVTNRLREIFAAAREHFSMTIHISPDLAESDIARKNIEKIDAALRN